jgi:hypothetical protein
MLIKFDKWRKLRESSPATRNKWNAALGLQPMYSADVYGHGTPVPWIAKRLTKKLKKKKKKGFREWVLANYEVNDF